MDQEQFWEFVKTKLESIEKQTKLTNGRVNRIERFRDVTCACIVAAVAAVAIMLYAHTHGWIEAIIKYGG